MHGLHLGMKRSTMLRIALFAVVAVSASSSAQTAPRSMVSDQDSHAWNSAGTSANDAFPAPRAVQDAWLRANLRLRTELPRVFHHDSPVFHTAAAHATALAANVAVLELAPIIASAKSGAFAHSTSAIPPPQA